MRLAVGAIQDDIRCIIIVSTRCIKVIIAIDVGYDIAIRTV
jgi:hypothetical protein